LRPCKECFGIFFDPEIQGGGPQDGWNDPPSFAYNTHGASSPRHTVLNKRVSFPLGTPANAALDILTPKDPSAAGVLLNPKDGPPKLPPVHILPPSLSTSVHPPVPLVVPSLSPPIDHSHLPPSFASAIRDSRTTESLLSDLLERLELDSAESLRKYTKRVLHEVLDVCKDSIQERSREDVQTRLSLLDDQWREGKLSEEATVKLGCLASALKNNDLKQADSMHLSLMVDHISEVSQWMVGVKRLINELKLSQGPSPSSSPKQVFTPPETAMTTGHTPHTGKSGTPEDVCIDTDKFSNWKPILMPEMLVPSTTSAEYGSEVDGQAYQQHSEQHGDVGNNKPSDTVGVSGDE
jgi:hypothetical protein